MQLSQTHQSWACQVCQGHGQLALPFRAFHPSPHCGMPADATITILKIDFMLLAFSMSSLHQMQEEMHPLSLKPQEYQINQARNHVLSHFIWGSNRTLRLRVCYLTDQRQASAT